jgi:acetyltransferase-like isoleucine patch superfamily enzyme
MEIALKNRVFLYNFCSINCLESVEISESVNLYCGRRPCSNEPNFKIEYQKFTSALKNCCLGSNVTVLKGLTIGNNSIIGTRCLVFKDAQAIVL